MNTNSTDTTRRPLPVETTTARKVVDISSFLTDDSSLVKSNKVLEFSKERINPELLGYFERLNQFDSDVEIFLSIKKIESLKIESHTNIQSEIDLNVKIDSLLNLMKRSFATAIILV